MSMGPKIEIIWRNKENKFKEFKMKVSREFVQDFTTPHHLTLDYPENNKEVSLDNLLNMCRLEGSEYGQLREELNKKLIPYIRNEKLNKLIN